MKRENNIGLFKPKQEVLGIEGILRKSRKKYVLNHFNPSRKSTEWVWGRRGRRNRVKDRGGDFGLRCGAKLIGYN